MKQIQFDRFGPPSQVAKCIDVPEPAPPTAWEVTVEILACPINPSDLATLAGQYGILPKTPALIGMEGIGTVLAIGKSIQDLAPGDRVVMQANNNWTQRRNCARAALTKVPATADVLQLSMLKVNPATAWLMLHDEINLQSGEWVIQNAPLSNVGRMVIQFSRHLGLKTINIVRRSEAIDEVLALGGDVALLDNEQLSQAVADRIGRSRVRLALDGVGGESTHRLATCLNEFGQIINYGMLAGTHCQLHPEQLIFRGIRLKGFWLSKVLNRMSLGDRNDLFATLTQWMVEEKIAGVIDSCFSLEQISAALLRAEQGSKKGKVILLPNQNRWLQLGQNTTHFEPPKLDSAGMKP